MNEPGAGPDRTGAVAFDVTPLGRRRRRRLDPGLLIVGLAAVLVVAAVARPWASQPAPALVAHDPSPAASSPSAPASPVAQASASVVPDLTNLATVIHVLATYSGTWGVGAGAVPQAPPSRDATGWSAWVAVRPVSTQGSTTDVTELPAGVTSRDLCTDLPQLPSGAQVIAITAPSGPIGALGIRGWRLRGFRDDPPNIEVLSGLRQITPFQSGDISYLQRDDGQPWTDGRYEFWLAGSAGTTLTVCLGQV
jgi:hypothetical protein